MNWSEIKQQIYFYDGSLRDVIIKDTTASDWEKWINFVNENCKVDWLNGKTVKNEPKIKFDIVNEFFEGNEDYSSSANILLDKILMNVHFFKSTEIKFDIDPRDFHTITQHEQFMELLGGMAKAINKSVLITGENEPEQILITIQAS